MERESSKDFLAFFLWRKGSFSSRNRPSRNSTLFSSRRSAWSVLKCNHARQRSFCRTFRYTQHSMAKTITFLKGNLCIFKCFIDVLKNFLFGDKEKLQNVPRFETDFSLMLLTFITRIAFCEDVRFRFWTLFDTQLMNFIRKYFYCLFQSVNIRILKAYLQYKVNGAEGQRGIVN